MTIEQGVTDELVFYNDLMIAVQERLTQHAQYGDRLSGEDARKAVLDIAEIIAARPAGEGPLATVVVREVDRVQRGSEDEELLEAVEAINGLLATGISHTLERMKLPVSREVFDANVERARKLSKASWAVDAVVTALKCDV